MKFQRWVNFLWLVGFVSIVSASRNNVCKKWTSYGFRDISKDCYYDIDAESDVPSIITRHGYKFEGLKAKTKDGYHLGVFRIPGKGIPVLLVHTYSLSSASFVSQVNKKDALAFLLADKGYDVYLLNFRGTQYSLQHEVYSADDHEFWDTGIDEIARYDLEAAFSLIERVSGQKKLLYIGHEVGATALIAYGSINPDKIKEKVIGAALISPLVEMRNSGSLLSRYIGRYPDFTWKCRQMFDLDILLSHYKYQKPLVNSVFKSGFLMFLFVLEQQISYGREKEFTAQSTPYYLNAYKEGGSYKIYLSINQYTARPFSAFDYGKDENMLRYRHHEPPLYNYSAIEVPLYIVHPTSESFLKKEDVDLLYSNLAKEAKTLGRLEITEEKITDYALIFGPNAKTLVYEPLLDKFEMLKQKIEEEKKKNEKKPPRRPLFNPFWSFLMQPVRPVKEEPKENNDSKPNVEEIDIGNFKNKQEDADDITANHSSEPITNESKDGKTNEEESKENDKKEQKEAANKDDAENESSEPITDGSKDSKTNEGGKENDKKEQKEADSKDVTENDSSEPVKEGSKDSKSNEEEGKENESSEPITDGSKDSKTNEEENKENDKKEQKEGDSKDNTGNDTSADHEQVKEESKDIKSKEEESKQNNKNEQDSIAEEEEDDGESGKK